MPALLPLPRLVFGPGSLAALPEELETLDASRPLLISDRGLERAGAVAMALRLLPLGVATHLDTPENPTTDGVDIAVAAYRGGRCDSVVALGGGSVIDTAKFVAALAAGSPARAADLLGRPERVERGVAPLIAIPTTVGTGSESSHVAALHREPHSPAVGTRGPRMVPRVAICDPDLARSLPPRLVAATGIDALSHCIEGFFAEPANPTVDALALDGAARAFAALPSAVQPGEAGDAARTELMAAAFAGGAAIHKGLGPAHAVAITCGDQGLHHGVLVAAALPHTLALVARHASLKADRMAAALGVRGGSRLGEAVSDLAASLGLPASYREAGYQVTSAERLVEGMQASPFNRASPYSPTREEFASIVRELT